MSAVLLSACGPTEDTTPAPPPLPPASLSLPASGRDSTAVLDSLASFVSRVDADTARMTRIQAQLEPTAGSTGLLTAWRADSVWQRLHIDATGAGFQTSDTYWLHDGTLVAARLELVRPQQQPAVERVWFRGTAIYRWVDAQGRQLGRDAQSTKTEVQMLRDRVTRIVSALPSTHPVESAR